MPFLDTVDEFLSKYGSPLGLAQSTSFYDEPPLWRYDDQVPPPMPPFSLPDLVYTVFLWVSGFVLICAALMPTYLAFESEIWAVMQPLIDLIEAFHGSFHDRVPLEINRYDFLAPETVKTQTAGLSKAIHQQSTWLSRQGLAGFKTFTPAPTKIIDVVSVHRMLAEIKSHSESHYDDLMLEFKICQQMQSRGLEASAQQQRKALQLVRSQRDAMFARYLAFLLRQPAIRLQYIQVCTLILMISHSEHAKVLDTFCKAALEVEDLHKQELAGKDRRFQQMMTQHQGELIAAKDQTALQKEKEHRRQMTRAASVYAALDKRHESLIEQHESLVQQHASLKRQHKLDALDHAEKQDADAEAREDYMRAHDNDMYEMEEELARKVAELQAEHAAEKRRLELRVEKLSHNCKWVKLLRKTSKEQNVPATILRQLNEAESALRELMDKVKPAMKRLAIDRNKQTKAVQDHLIFAVDLWQAYLDFAELLDEAPSEELSAFAELYLGLDDHGEKTRQTSFYPILDLESLLGVFDLPGARRAGDPPRLTSLAWGAMQPPADAPAETFIEWLAEQDFTADRWTELRQLAYTMARVPNTFNIRQILANCHILRRRDWAKL
ncbi:MAG: hypothetical protein OHK93_004349 [Ramalina farinacea]|uniref:Uncharacterized protein n=1 Tax=Ramalina farinacea TaxID=258253 RepID=A0AA43QK32_9LECA|nr:hypothetical protein [Ramalina farinacea]